MNTSHDEPTNGLAPPVGRPALSADPTADDSTFLPPPPAPDEGSGTPPVVSTPEELTPRRRVSRLIAVAVVGLAVVVAVGSWLVFRNGGEQEGTGPVTAELDRLATDPQQLYSVSFVDPNLYSIGDVVGSPDQLIVSLSASDRDELRVFGGDGTEMWRREFADELSTFELVDGQGDSDKDGDANDTDNAMDDILVGTPGSDDEQGTLALLDGATGTEKWSISVDEYENDVVNDREVVLFDYDNGQEARESGERAGVRVFDLASGEQIASGRFEGLVLSPWHRGDLYFVVRDQGALFVVDDTLEAISEAIPAPDGYIAVYDGDEVMVVSDDKLARYEIDGKEIASAEFDVDRIFGFEHVAGDSWAYWTELRECGVVTFDNETAVVPWKFDDCFWEAPPVRIGDGDLILAVRVKGESGLEGALVDATTGERVFSAPDSAVEPFANGVLVGDRGDEVTAYSLPGEEEMYSVPLDRRQRYMPLDNGYATYPYGPDAELEITVFG